MDALAPGDENSINDGDKVCDDDIGTDDRNCTLGISSLATACMARPLEIPLPTAAYKTT